MAHRSATPNEKPDPNTVANVEIGSGTDPADDSGGGYAGSPTVLEITDLVVPSGTLWRSEAHLLQSLDLEDRNGIQFAFSIETADPVPADHILRLDLGDSQNSHDSNDPISLSLPPGDTFALTTGFDTFWSLRNQLPDPPLSFTGYVQIVAAGPTPGDNPTTSDITIVRARAAFVIL